MSRIILIAGATLARIGGQASWSGVAGLRRSLRLFPGVRPWAFSLLVTGRLPVLFYRLVDRLGRLLGGPNQIAQVLVVGHLPYPN
jgi:hypothetical protein